ncbi:MAG: ABC-ATPase domain-containing protein [Candidatus Methanomethylophilaceae archaeon]|jgi:predicted ABC-class ATPase
MTFDGPLYRELMRLDGKGYRSYKELQKEYPLEGLTLFVDHVQGDPFAAPSTMRVRVPQTEAAFPPESFSSRTRCIALRDLIARRFWESARTHARAGTASGSSGVISIPRPGQTVLERSSVVVTPAFVEVRFSAGLPAFGRQVAGRLAADMLLQKLPLIVSESLFYSKYKDSKLFHHIQTIEDAQHIRSRLHDMGLVAFIADGSVLPRRSGVDPAPLRQNAIPFRSPDSLRIRMRTPNAGDVWGMGVPEGVTIIVGGGYHGKSTLLDAITEGVYDHLPGDGRELAVTRYAAVKVNVEDGRRVESVDIRPFISTLPGGVDTASFSTQNASGSTSQAANIMESLEMGSDVLLIDEDRSASNFMVRDRRMQDLVPEESEPITPFIDRVRQLWEEKKVSTVMVVGGSGEYLDIADTVLMMDAYVVKDVTDRARQVAAEHPSQRRRGGKGSFGSAKDRYPLGKDLDPRKGRKDISVSAKSLHSIRFGNGELDLSSVEQLVEMAQTVTIADVLVQCLERMDGSRNMRELVKEAMRGMSQDGLDSLGRLNGERASVRSFEIAATINRLRSLSAFQR